MKIAIMSFPGSPSHGASLQMYALYTTIKNLGHEPVILNYIPKKLFDKYNHTGEKTLKSFVTDIISKLLIPNTNKSFLDFERNWSKLPKNILTDKSKLNEITKDVDKIIVGSDQVWNMDITFSDYSFFLEFCNESRKKVAYAPSFGNDNIYEKDKNKIKELLNDFLHLSAREKRGCEIVKNLIGKDIPMVCDPTFLLNKEEWKKISKKTKYKDKYVLLYNIKYSSTLYQKALQFAKKQNLKIVIIGGRLREYFNKKEIHAFGVGPAEFLGLIEGAEYIFTNSFHGVALSIILRKNFYVEYSSNTNVRLINLIEATGLEQCVTKIDDEYVERYNFINYSRVEERLNPIIRLSKNYLRRVLSDE